MDSSIFKLLNQHIEDGLKIHSVMLVASQEVTQEILDPCTPPERDELHTEKTDITILAYPKKTVFHIKAITRPHKTLSIGEFNHVLGLIEGSGYDLTSASIKRISLNIDDKIGCNFWIKGKAGAV